MSSASGTIELESIPPENSGGVDAFTERCLDLGQISTDAMLLARQDLTDDSVKETAKDMTFNVMPSPVAIATAINFLKNLERIKELKKQELSSAQLFEDAFEFTPESRVETSWYNGGLVFWCESGDYSTVFVNVRRTSIERAVDKADGSVAVALGPAYFNAIRGKVPVAIVKYEDSPKEIIEGGEIPSPLAVGDLENIHIEYKKGGDPSHHIFYTKSRGRNKYLHMIDISANGEQEHESVPLGLGPIFMSKGPYGVLVDDAKVSFKYGNDGQYEEPVLTLVTKGDLNKDGSVRKRFKKSMKPTVIHELQHLVNGLSVPIRAKAEKPPRLAGMSREQIVSKIADFILKGPIDKSLSNEFLAQAMTEGRELEDIRRHMIGEVETMGIMYNYLNEDTDIVKDALPRNKDKFENLAESVYLVMAETATKYGEFVTGVSEAFEEFELAGYMTREQTVGLLLPHPFHTWPTVLRAVERHYKNAEV